MNYSLILKGGCHCGQLRLQFSSNKAAKEFAPRACDCSFCQKHGASYISDPDGALEIRATSVKQLSRYQQGSNSAEFLCCRECGVLVAVIYQHDNILYGAVNAACIDDRDIALGEKISSSPQLLSAAEKQQRWQALWVRNVQLLMRK